MRRRFDADYLKTRTHGKNILKVMTVLALYGPRNKYELAKMSKLSYALVHKIMKELAKSGMIRKYGKLEIEKFGDHRKEEGGKYKHETLLWGLSESGMWVALSANPILLNKWDDVKKKNERYMESSLEYFDIALEIARNGRLFQEYGRRTYHTRPNPRMIVQAFLDLVVMNEEKIEATYDKVVDFLQQYPGRVIRRLITMVEREKVEYEKYVHRCEILERKLRALERQESSRQTSPDS